MPDISLIIPCYNVPSDLIERCVNSILSQEEVSFELLLIDDGSAEPFQTALADLAKTDDRIHLIRQENAGVSAARNTGLRQATGSYIMFADADDYLLPGALQEAFRIVEETGADLAIAQIIDHEPPADADVHLPGDTAPKYDRLKDEQRSWLIGHLVGRPLQEGMAHFGRGCWSRLIRRTLAVSYEFDTALKCGEDILWNIQILQKAQNVQLVHSVWYYYNMDTPSETRSYKADLVERGLLELTRFREILDLNNDEQYRGYCDRIIENIDKIGLNLLLHPDCTLSAQEKKAFQKKIYTELPWKEAVSGRYYKLADKKNRFKVQLLRLHLFYFFKKVYYKHR